jgi:hypothetical protein
MLFYADGRRFNQFEARGGNIYSTDRLREIGARVNQRHEADAVIETLPFLYKLAMISYYTDG